MLTKTKKTKIIKDSRIHDTDTGSTEVQVSIISKQIDELASHLKKHPKDKHSRRGLLGMVAARQKHMKYLLKKDPKRHAVLQKKIDSKKK